MDPTVVFVYDDGPLADYEDVYPVHRRFDAPACVAVVTEWLGETPRLPARLVGRGTTHLDESHLREFVADGWEVCAHGVAHRPLDATRTTAPVPAGDRVLPVETALHGRVAGDTLRIDTPADGEVRASVARPTRHPRQTALVLRDPLTQPVPAGSTVRYAKSVVREELAGAKRALDARGFDVTSVALPYSRYGPTARAVVSETYDAVANAAVGGLNTNPENPHELRRQYLGRDALSDAQLERFMETVRERDALALFGGHSHAHVDAARVADALRLAENLGIRVTTLRDAAADVRACARENEE
ncbi:polysaccharide deacetylase family protein [Halarchaeum sp. P4]|uniref:polysaccharide deacetylase family protein n=1 Tax=Halarchaeum sp. P4 TaxID=3421639 RepID=UPI003EB7DEB0